MHTACNVYGQVVPPVSDNGWQYQMVFRLGWRHRNGQLGCWLSCTRNIQRDLESTVSENFIQNRRDGNADYEDVAMAE